MIKPWKLLGRRMAADFKYLRVRADRLESPRNGHTAEFFVIEVPDWVNVIGFTEDDELILVRQWRWGVAQATLEIPGGIVDPDEPLEEAARRELREETGHECAAIVPLGAVHPNPANQSNRCATFLATGCRKVGELRQDQGEDIEVVTMPMKEVRDAVRRGEVTHGLVLAALYLLELHREANDA